MGLVKHFQTKSLNVFWRVKGNRPHNPYMFSVEAREPGWGDQDCQARDRCAVTMANALHSGRTLPPARPLPPAPPAARHLALNLHSTAQSLCRLGQVMDLSEPQFSRMENGDKISPTSWVCWEAKACDYRQRVGTMPGTRSGLVRMFAVIDQLPWGGLPATR